MSVSSRDTLEMLGRGSMKRKASLLISKSRAGQCRVPPPSLRVHLLGLLPEPVGRNSAIEIHMCRCICNVHKGMCLHVYT